MAEDYNIQEDIQDASDFNPTDDERFAERSIIKVIGVGGGGGNAVNYMFKQEIPLINYVVCNTDKQHLKEMSVPERVILGYEVTHGRGAGNNPEVGRKCAEASVDEIRALFDEDTEMVFITAGMGGGTGTGAAPVVARLAKEAGVLTIGIVTVPFLFEGEKKILKALEGAREMQKHVDALLVINNENLLEIYPDTDFFQCFARADETLANAARSISEIISERCYINVDFQDVKTTLKDSDTAIISTATGEGEHRISDAIQNALHSPLLKTHDIKTSKRLLLKFSCSKNSETPIVAREIGEIRKFTSKLPSTIDVKWGIADNPELGNAVKVTILASGFDVTLRDEPESQTIKLRSGADDAENLGDDAPDFVFTEPEQDTPEKTASQVMADFYGSDITKGLQMDRLKMRCLVLTPEEFDDDDVISHLEKRPTVSRDSRANDEIHNLRIAAQNYVPKSGANDSAEKIIF